MDCLNLIHSHSSSFKLQGPVCQTHCNCCSQSVNSARAGNPTSWIVFPCVTTHVFDQDHGRRDQRCDEALLAKLTAIAARSPLIAQLLSQWKARALLYRLRVQCDSCMVLTAAIDSIVLRCQAFALRCASKRCAVHWALSACAALSASAQSGEAREQLRAKTSQARIAIIIILPLWLVRCVFLRYPFVLIRFFRFVFSWILFPSYFFFRFVCSYWFLQIRFFKFVSSDLFALMCLFGFFFVFLICRFGFVLFRCFCLVTCKWLCLLAHSTFRAMQVHAILGVARRPEAVRCASLDCFALCSFGLCIFGPSGRAELTGGLCMHHSWDWAVMCDEK